MNNKQLLLARSLVLTVVLIMAGCTMPAPEPCPEGKICYPYFLAYPIESPFNTYKFKAGTYWVYEKEGSPGTEWRIDVTQGYAKYDTFEVRNSSRGKYGLSEAWVMMWLSSLTGSSYVTICVGSHLESRSEYYDYLGSTTTDLELQGIMTRTNIQDVTVNQYQFDSAVLIKKYLRTTDGQIISENAFMTWVKHVGCVKIEYINSSDAVVERWLLKSYNIID